jgi:cobalamin biosynthesis protein CbiD
VDRDEQVAVAGQRGVEGQVEEGLGIVAGEVAVQTDSTHAGEDRRATRR